MKIRSLARAGDKLLQHGDLYLASALRTFRPKPLLIVLMFHTVFAKPPRVEQPKVMPFERFTLHQFSQLIDYFLVQEYTFIRAGELAQAQPHSRSIALTFDDGYFNNTLLLPILESYKIPATFFVSANHVLQEKAFWWDVILRERSKIGHTHLQVLQECEPLKVLTHAEIDQYLTREFGATALKPQYDAERPMTPAELRDFSRSPYVSIGNHTADHAILTRYTPQQAKQQIQAAQIALTELTGTVPTAIAYPDGGYSDNVVSLAAECGLTVGVTVEPTLPRFPLDPMRIGRLQFSGLLDVRRQCRALEQTIYGAARTRLLYRQLQKQPARQSTPQPTQ